MVTLSVIVPVHNGSPTIGRCVSALLEERPFEIIVVNDGSTDDTAQIVQSFPITLMNLAAPGGPARARNTGAACAKGDILVFIDADVEVHAGALDKIASLFSSRPELHAAFGSYDDTPEERSPVALYKNLLHHYVHQHAHRHAATFWSGLGAVRRDTYLSLGGLNEAYSRPSIEDIEFGYRLFQAGLLCELHKDIQGKHLKRWTLVGLIRTDLFDRAIPWTTLMLRTGRFPSDLNFGWRHKASAVLAVTMLAAPFFGGWKIAPFVVLLLSVAFILVNLPLFRFLGSRGGGRLLFSAVPLHLLYSLCCVFGFAAGVCTHAFRLVFGKALSRPARAKEYPTATKS